MLTHVRQQIIKKLWNQYHDSTPQIHRIAERLRQKGLPQLFLDHFAVIDLPGPNTGIPTMCQLFSAIGYETQGKDYLADKQNDFLWMAESNSHHAAARDVLPQVVVADFRLDEMPPTIKKIIEKYSHQAPPAPLAQIHHLVSKGDEQSTKQLSDIIIHYLAGRDWPLPTCSEFYTVQEFNELLAWVLVFGRKPNHFTLSVHLLSYFTDLAEFHRLVEDDLRLQLNHEGGVMKGGRAAGIAQGSTAGTLERVTLADGDIKLPTGFVEFVWRYPRDETCEQPVMWNDYFTGFVAEHADNVIESLYVNESA